MGDLLVDESESLRGEERPPSLTALRRFSPTASKGFSMKHNEPTLAKREQNFSCQKNCICSVQVTKRREGGGAKR